MKPLYIYILRIHHYTKIANTIGKVSIFFK